MSVGSDRSWLRALTTYLLASAVLHLIWEVVQLPLYIIWRTGTLRDIAFAIVHCTVGDLMIAAVSLIAAIVFVGRRDWPAKNYVVVAAGAIAIDICYTTYSEWLNLSRGNWAYSELMRVVPVLGAGLSPLLQGLSVPAIAVGCAVPKAMHE